MEPEVRERFEQIEAALAAVARSQAAAAARMDRAEARMDRAEARMERAEARMDRMDASFEKRMKGFEKLVQIGLKEMIRMDQKINILIDAQQRTDATLRAFVKSLQKGSNGR